MTLPDLTALIEHHRKQARIHHEWAHLEHDEKTPPDQEKITAYLKISQRHAHWAELLEQMRLSFTELLAATGGDNTPGDDAIMSDDH